MSLKHELRWITALLVGVPVVYGLWFYAIPAVLKRPDAFIIAFVVAFTLSTLALRMR